MNPTVIASLNIGLKCRREAIFKMAALLNKLQNASSRLGGLRNDDKTKN